MYNTSSQPHSNACCCMLLTKSTMSSSTEHCANRNPTSEGTYDPDSPIIGMGKYKFVVKGKYAGNGVRSELKFLKFGPIFSSDCFVDDVRAAAAALPQILAVVCIKAPPTSTEEL